MFDSTKIANSLSWVAFFSCRTCKTYRNILSLVSANRPLRNVTTLHRLSKLVNRKDRGRSDADDPIDYKL